MSCLAIIRSARDKMSANEKKLADFILDNASLIRDYSSQQIAASVGISQSSVVKFSQKLGYKGFTDLKLAIHETVVKQESNVAVLHGQASSQIDAVSKKDRLLNAKCDALSETATLNSSVDMTAISDTLCASKCLLIVGGGFAGPIASGLAARINSKGQLAVFEADSNLQSQYVSNFGRGDCLIIFSSRGQAQHLGRLAKSAKSAGATLISITSQSANPIAAIADIKLFTIAEAADAGFGEILISQSQQHVADMVYCAVDQWAGSKGSSSTASQASKSSKAK